MQNIGVDFHKAFFFAIEFLIASFKGIQVRRFFFTANGTSIGVYCIAFSIGRETFSQTIQLVEVLLKRRHLLMGYCFGLCLCNDIVNKDVKANGNSVGKA